MKSTRNESRTQPFERKKVLVVCNCNGDGFIVVYGEKSVDVKIVTMPSVARVNEALAEQLLEAGLPRAYRNIFWPGMRRAIATIRPVTVDQLAKDELDRRLFNCLAGLATHNAEVPSWAS